MVFSPNETWNQHIMVTHYELHRKLTLQWHAVDSIVLYNDSRRRPTSPNGCIYIYFILITFITIFWVQKMFCPVPVKLSSLSDQMARECLVHLAKTANMCLSKEIQLVNLICWWHYFSLLSKLTNVVKMNLQIKKSSCTIISCSKCTGHYKV